MHILPLCYESRNRCSGSRAQLIVDYEPARINGACPPPCSAAQCRAGLWVTALTLSAMQWGCEAALTSVVGLRINSARTSAASDLGLKRPEASPRRHRSQLLLPQASNCIPASTPPLPPCPPALVEPTTPETCKEAEAKSRSPFRRSYFLERNPLLCVFNCPLGARVSLSVCQLATEPASADKNQGTL